MLSLALCRREGAPVLVDPAQIEQVLLNLALNARHAMPGGGELRISTMIEQITEQRMVGLDTIGKGTYVVLVVTDSGAGIPPDIIDKIFEPFFTTKPKERGTGLGLSTVYGIAHQLGGAVGVSSKVGLGAALSVWIPMAMGSEVTNEDEPSVSVWPDIPAATILFVDDDDSVRSLASRLIAKGGHRVLVASNAGGDILWREVAAPQSRSRRRHALHGWLRSRQEASRAPALGWVAFHLGPFREGSRCGGTRKLPGQAIYGRRACAGRNGSPAQGPEGGTA